MSVFDVMKKLKLLDWYTLLVGLERGWCEKGSLISYCEDIINRQATCGEIDNDLISIIAEKNIAINDLIAMVVQFLKKNKKPMLQEEKNEAIEKWRLAHLDWLLQMNWSEQEKIDALQELYAQFGFPSDMAACSIYSRDKIDPLVATVHVVEKLSRQFCE